MARIDDLLASYGRQVALPWDTKLAGAQRVWFAVYDKTDERRLRARIGEFELRSKEADHDWVLHDLSDAFAHWMVGRKYKDSYFENPTLLESALEGFRKTVIDQMRDLLDRHPDPNAIVAVQGIACLFGFVRVSDVVNAIESCIRGRLLVFFPGEHTKNNYRLLDARDGWNYLATPITSYQEASLE